MSETRPPVSFLVSAGLLALMLRLLFSLGYWTGQPLTRDEQEYLSLARGIASGAGFRYDGALLASDPDPFGRAPGYPLFLALVGGGRSAGPSVPATVKAAQSVVGAIGVVIIALIASRLAGPRAGRAAALIAACYPPLVWIAGYAYSEAIAWTLGLALVWLFDRAVQTRQALLMACCGAMCGVAMLVRPSLLLFLGLGALWLIRRRGFTLTLTFVLGAAIVLAPWTLRNSRTYGRFVLVATEGGVTFWTGNHPLAIGEGDFAANPALKRASLELHARYPQLTEDQMESRYYRDALTWVLAHPGRWLVLELKKLFYLVVPVGPSYRLHSRRYYVATVISYGLLLPAALAGWRTARQRRHVVPALWLLGASAVLASLLFFPQERFRIPAIDPVLIVCASTLCASDLQVRKGSRT